MAHLGWKAGPEQYPPLELLDYAIAAERAGFDWLDVSDHFHPWSEDGQACFSWSWLGAAAVKTSTIVLGTGVTCPFLRYHPAVIAQAAATLGAMAPGRAYLGLGTGEALNEFAATGQWPNHHQRQAMLAESIALMRELWTGKDVTFSGTYFETKQARLFSLPAQPMPIYISSLVPDSAAFAGEHGDGLFTVGGQPDDLYKSILRNFEEGARRAGKDPARMPRLIELNVAYTDDEQGAIREMRKYWAGSFVPALFDQRIYTPAMSAQNGSVVGPDTAKRKMCLSARAEDHVRFAQHYLDLGFTHLIYHCAGPDQRAFLESYGLDVLPRIHKQQGATSSPADRLEPAGAR